MKKILTVVVAVFAVSYHVAEAQKTLTSEAELLQLDREIQFRRGELERRHKKSLECGQAMFGVDERWGREEFKGTFGKRGRVIRGPFEYRIGDWGCLGRCSFRILGKISDTECLVSPVYRGKETEVILIRGLDMSKVVDGVEFVLQHPIMIQNTYTYTTVLGGKKTVFVLECNEDKINKLAEAARKAAEDILFRKWTDPTGKFSVEARFIEFKSGRAHLLRRDTKKKIEVSMSRLSKADQKWIRDELRRRLEKKRQEEKQKRADAKKKAARKAPRR